MVTVNTPDRAAIRTMKRQHGVLSHADAVACGLSDAQIAHRIRAGWWQRAGIGVYVNAATPNSWKRDAMLAVKAGPSGTLAGHFTAAALHGLCTAPAVPDVIVPRRASGRIRLGVMHRSSVPDIDRTTVDGIPCTKGPRTVVDCASEVDRDTLADLVDEAITARVASRDAILASATRAGRRNGKPLLRQVLDAWTPAITPQSVAEMRLLRRLAEWGFDPPVTQFRVVLPDGSVVRLDCAWPGWLVAIEYDGLRFHGPRQWEADQVREAVLRQLGWDILRADKLDLLPGEHRLRDELQAAVDHRVAA